MLKYSNHRRYYHAQAQKNDQPGHTFLHTFLKRLLQVLLCSQAGEHGVIFTHLIIYQINDIGRCDHTQKPVVIIQYRNGILGIILQFFDTIINILFSIHIWIRSDHQILKCPILPGNDQILQVNGSVKLLLLCYHKQCRNIVILGRLLYQAAHCLFHSQILTDNDTVGGHLASNLIIIKRSDHFNIMTYFIIHQIQKKTFFRLIDLVQHFHKGICLHP